MHVPNFFVLFWWYCSLTLRYKFFLTFVSSKLCYWNSNVSIFLIIHIFLFQNFLYFDQLIRTFKKRRQKRKFRKYFLAVKLCFLNECFFFLFQYRNVRIFKWFFVVILNKFYYSTFFFCKYEKYFAQCTIYIFCDPLIIDYRSAVTAFDARRVVMMRWSWSWWWLVIMMMNTVTERNTTYLRFPIATRQCRNFFLSMIIKLAIQVHHIRASNLEIEVRLLLAQSS